MVPGPILQEKDGPRQRYFERVDVCRPDRKVNSLDVSESAWSQDEGGDVVRLLRDLRKFGQHVERGGAERVAEAEYATRAREGTCTCRTYRRYKWYETAVSCLAGLSLA